MGSCANLCSTPNKSFSSKIDYQQLTDKEHQQHVHRLLILGAKSSGKTTIIKQLNFIQGIKDENDSKSRKYSIMNIRKNCIENMIVLCEMNEDIDEKYIETLNQFDIMNDNDLYNIANYMINIWSQQHIKSSYSLRFHIDATNMNYAYFLDDNMQYFFDKIDEIMNINYVPSDEDIIKYKTIKYSITDLSFHFHADYQPFNFVDIGDYDCKSQIYSDVIQPNGQFEDRKIIFTAALTDYCIYDADECKMRMQISMDYFKQVVASRVVLRMNEIILIFTKIDIFERCLASGIPLSHFFKDEWDGQNYVNPKLRLVVTYMIRHECDQPITHYIVQLMQDYVESETSEDEQQKTLSFCCQEATHFIAQQYESLVQEIDGYRHYQIYIHRANCMDARNIERVFSDVRHIVINSGLSRGPI